MKHYRFHVNFAFNLQALEHPVRTNQIPRLIPEQTVYTQPLPGIIMGGVLPFGCIFIQLFFILNSIWSSQMYYMFGFLFLVFIILVITCAETTILLCYFHLCAEDYHWWWRSYLTSGFTAVYLFLYCCHYFFTKLQIEDAASGFLYFGYTLIMVFLFNLLTGSIGFFACFWFIRKIYSVVKVDWSIELFCDLLLINLVQRYMFYFRRGVVYFNSGIHKVFIISMNLFDIFERRRIGKIFCYTVESLIFKCWNARLKKILITVYKMDCFQILFNLFFLQWTFYNVFITQYCFEYLNLDYD